ncbi:bifunctional aspartate kinase/homoserine dehydrogenase I [Buchnera aphidicola]|uniref:Bifunctional aspartokinase/homoserine dehydrogenase n=1 Tax=Buchnera aphidicola str. USDA (Myzus persicae) TaxID=1009856 RepID=W0P567_BUCMP|nr:bifunctional aspartate kinase/homoserine dehydrogenase I [Buchnera aphidicola]AHG60178.1 Thra [Buchnera aphidicola str. USDA (Myzus persicae)]AHG60757.1 Thra [Buchnera aphidicola str. W106 (Myzus persicae)]AHG61329.1 Thra [Buchnera aphidicola str. G002 (Myzus persicae)]AHG61902.1 Thra [Buchnera aphidicola str. F009 (Myzus persicae)]
MQLLKFGGTSLANAEKFLCVSNIIEEKIKFEQIAVVLSAPANITNYLVTIIEKKINHKILDTINIVEHIFIELINNLLELEPNFNYQKIEKKIKQELDKLKNILQGVILLKQCPDSIRAIIISRGEILSVLIMQSILESRKHSIKILNPVAIFLSIGNYLDSTVDIDESKKRINKISIEKNNIILMPGFIAGNQKKELVVLGRNGSDYSAAILAACLNANCCEIWTDVDGVFTCDPRIVSNAHLLKSLSYEEAMELSYFGAKVLHPRTIEPLSQFKIPCFIKNTTNIQSSGTLICQKNESEKKFLKGVTYLDNITMFNISGFSIKNVGNIIPRIFTTISRNNVKIILITQSSSENKISFCILSNQVDTILSSLNKEFQLELKDRLLKSFKITNDLSILSVVGSNISKKNNISAKICTALGSAKINILAIAQGSSKHSISMIIQKKYILKAVQNVHNALFFNKKIIYVYLIGIGGIGNTLLEQILQQTQYLNENNISIKVLAIANSKKILLSDHAINLSNWKNDFKKSTQKFNLEVLNDFIKKNYFPNSVIIDCTSDQFLSEQYVNFLYYNFHVVTSNKKANTSQWTYYEEIRHAVNKTNKKFLYETNVGAGLPVIETLQNLFKTGDRLVRFKGILSGSLSFIFGRLEEGVLLSQATKEAKELGFTEPNPSDDLSGIDVARKLLILAREAGYKIELKDIIIEPIVPITFPKYKDIDQFLLKLKELDSCFLKRINEARNQGNILRFVGTIEKNGKCYVKIEAINIHDPLYKVKNGENALAFYTNYYQPIPLVLRGYGAGNKVTASGVFSDLLRTLS